MFLLKKNFSCRVGGAYSRGGGRLFVETIFRGRLFEGGGGLIRGWTLNRGNTVSEFSCYFPITHRRVILACRLCV